MDTVGRDGRVRVNRSGRTIWSLSVTIVRRLWDGFRRVVERERESVVLSSDVDIDFA